MRTTLPRLLLAAFTLSILPPSWEASAAPDLRTVAAAVTPNDPLYPDLQRRYLDLIQAPAAWGIHTGSPSTVIAILDSGVLCSHPDIAPNLWRNPKEVAGNGIDDDGNGYVDDVHGYDFVGAETGDPNVPTIPPPDSDPCLASGDPSTGNGRDDDGAGGADAGVAHGTQAAGIAAAAGNNGEGIAGICWRCSIMVVRVVNPEGTNVSSQVAEGITYAARNGARVINLSVGGHEISQGEIAAIDAAVAGGAVVVASAGNFNRNPIEFPARLPNVVAVGASDKAAPDGRAPFSSWGTGVEGNRAVDVVAPGVDLATTHVFSGTDQQAGRGNAGTAAYANVSGTSLSAPVVSGLAGLMLSHNPALTPARVREILKSTAVRLSDDPDDNPDAGPEWAGAGRIDAAAALQAATPAGGVPAPAPRAPASGTMLGGLGTTLEWENTAGATQFQVQVIPANNDGPAINLILDIASRYSVPEPVFGSGPYVMLPGMTYTWRVRTTTATTSIDENSSQWGPWSPTSTFRTRPPAAGSIGPVAPASGASVSSLTPTLQWQDQDPAIFYYEVQLSADQRFGESGPSAPVYWELRHGGATVPPRSYSVSAQYPLQAATTYYWRIRPRVQGDGVPAAWTPTWSFRTP